MSLATITFWIAVIAAVIIFLSLSRRIPLKIRILIVILIPFFAVALVFLLSIIFSLLIVLLAIILVAWFFLRGKRWKKIRF